jgi:hypothetical protein
LWLSVRSAIAAVAARMTPADAQCFGLSIFAGSMVGFTVCLFVVAVAYIVTRAREGPNKSFWLKTFRVLYVSGGPAVLGLTASYPLYLKHVYHATSIFSDTPPEMSRYFLAYSSSGLITLTLGLWWLNRHARRETTKPART